MLVLMFSWLRSLTDATVFKSHEMCTSVATALRFVRTDHFEKNKKTFLCNRKEQRPASPFDVLRNSASTFPSASLMLPLSSQCETPHPSYKPPHQLLPGLCVRYMRSLWKEKEMERQAPLRIEANSFSLEKCPLLLQQAAEAPACLEINIMLVSRGGHKHETVFCLENKPYLLTNHLICQKTMSTASICVLSLGDSLRETKTC